MTNSPKRSVVDELERVHAIIRWILENGSPYDAIVLHPTGRNEYGVLEASFSYEVGTPTSGYVIGYDLIPNEPVCVKATVPMEYSQKPGVISRGMAYFEPGKPYPQYRVKEPLRYNAESIDPDADLSDLQWEVQDPNTGNWLLAIPSEAQHPWLGHQPIECYAIHGWHAAGYSQGHPPQVERIVVVCHENDTDRVWEAFIRGLFGRGWLIHIDRDEKPHRRLVNVDSRFAKNLTWRTTQNLQEHWKDAKALAQIESYIRSHADKIIAPDEFWRLVRGKPVPLGRVRQEWDNMGIS